MPGCPPSIADSSSFSGARAPAVTLWQLTTVPKLQERVAPQHVVHSATCSVDNDETLSTSDIYANGDLSVILRTPHLPPTILHMPPPAPQLLTIPDYARANVHLNSYRSNYELSVRQQPKLAKLCTGNDKRKAFFAILERLPVRDTL